MPTTRTTASPKIERRLAAIMVADVAGYSRLMGIDEVGSVMRRAVCSGTRRAFF
jgi:class 3 adenylate cyclase